MKHSQPAIPLTKVPSKIMLFDLDLGGHHGTYIQHLIEYWHKEKLSGGIEIVVRPEFLQIHDDAVNLVTKYQLQNLKFTTLTEAETASLNAGQSSVERFFRNFKRWKLFCKYATQLEVTHALHMYFDTYELPIAFGVRAPCPFSGIYFRPMFHYREFTNYVPSWNDRFQQLKGKIILARAIQHPQLKTLFCLDPFAVKHIEQFRSLAQVPYLPDPVQTQNQSEITPQHLHKQLGIQSNRQVLLLFGALNGRKGIYELLDAIAQLPHEYCQKICLIMAGGANTSEQIQIKAKVAEICQTNPVQIIEYYNFIPEDHVLAYFQLADIVLAPYQRHVGMSGILLLAATAGKPILSSDYGLMGELVRRYHLGLTVDSTKPEEIVKGITRCLTEPSQTLCDRTQMQSFAEQHSAEYYASTIFQYLDHTDQNKDSFHDTRTEK
jgi:glycosyltransferase involved in cell wall biosynthesis